MYICLITADIQVESWTNTNMSHDTFPENVQGNINIYRFEEDFYVICNKITIQEIHTHDEDSCK